MQGLFRVLRRLLVAYKVSQLFGSHSASFDISKFVPEMNIVSVIQTGVLAALCALVSIIFCVAMKYSHYKLKVTFNNTYIRAFVGGCAIILLTLIIGNQDYNGAGSDVISAALEQGTAQLV